MVAASKQNMTTWFHNGPYAPVGHNPRVWIESEPTECHQLVSQQCLWGGSDKHWFSDSNREYLSYEISLDQWNQVIEILTNTLGNPVAKDKR